MAEKPESEKLPHANLPYVEREIGEHLYRITRLDWWSLQDLISGLTEILGPSLEGLGTGISLGDLLEVDSSEILPALASALGRATGAKGQALQLVLGRQTIVEVEDRAVQLDKATMGIWFSQTPDEAIPWLLFALEVQVKDFFGPLLRAAPSPQASQPNAPTTQRTSSPRAKGQRSQST